jgi:hypothetical protein
MMFHHSHQLCGSQDISWIPCHTAADALIDFRHVDLDTCTFTHLTHPKPVPWSQLAGIMATELGVPLVSYKQWLHALEALVIPKVDGSQGDETSIALLKDVPALRLLSVYKGIAEDASAKGDAFGSPKLATTNSLRFSPTLRDQAIPRIEEGDIRAWLNYWRQSRLLA